MACAVAYLVFLVPVAISIPAAAYVMYDILQNPDRELDMWPGGFNSSHAGGHAGGAPHTAGGTASPQHMSEIGWIAH